MHYPIPLHLQEALKYLGYKLGDFPVAEQHCREVISFPVDQHLTREEQDYVIETVREFYRRKTSMTAAQARPLRRSAARFVEEKTELMACVERILSQGHLHDARRCAISSAASRNSPAQNIA